MRKEKTLDTPFGLRIEKATVHTSRSLMLRELAILFSSLSPRASFQQYRDAITEQNVLGLTTQRNRLKTAGFLSQLYSLDPSVTVFRVLRQIWEHDIQGRPLLVCLCACGRDYMLRDSAPIVLRMERNARMVREDFEAFLEHEYPRFLSLKTRKSTAQNLAASWAHSGFLNGRVSKIRIQPVATPGAAAYALLLGYLSGIRGGMLFRTIWARILDQPSSELEGLAREAARLGLIDMKMSGNITEIGFKALLSEEEMRVVHEQN